MSNDDIGSGGFRRMNKFLNIFNKTEGKGNINQTYDVKFIHKTESSGSLRLFSLRASYDMLHFANTFSPIIL